MFFPSWRYHRTEKPRIVKNPDEDQALGEGWADTPAAFLEEAPALLRPNRKHPAAADARKQSRP